MQGIRTQDTADVAHGKYADMLTCCLTAKMGRNCLCSRKLLDMANCDTASFLSLKCSEYC